MSSSGSVSPAGEQRSAADADCDRVGHRTVNAAQLAQSRRRAKCGSALPLNTPASAPPSAADPAAEISRLRRENERLRARHSKKHCGNLLGTRNEVLRDRGYKAIDRKISPSHETFLKSRTCLIASAITVGRTQSNGALRIDDAADYSINHQNSTLPER